MEVIYLLHVDSLSCFAVYEAVRLRDRQLLSPLGAKLKVSCGTRPSREAARAAAVEIIIRCQLQTDSSLLVVKLLERSLCSVRVSRRWRGRLVLSRERGASVETPARDRMKMSHGQILFEASLRLDSAAELVFGGLLSELDGGWRGTACL